jgi:hypothetical protein
VNLLKIATFAVLLYGHSFPSLGPKDKQATCQTQSLPKQVRDILKGEFTTWKIQQPSNLSPSAFTRWKGEKPLSCPGIALGKFETDTENSYAILLVPKEKSKGYIFVVFSEDSTRYYSARVLDKSDEAMGENFLIHGAKVTQFFDDKSRTKFDVKTHEGILFIDAGEAEYEADFYFWTAGSFRHEPVDH